MDKRAIGGDDGGMDADVLIVGGGLNGPALALALAGAGLSVAVIDARPLQARAEAGFDGRAYALALASQRLLAAVGVWQGLTAQPILKIVASDGRAGEGASPFALHFDAAEIEEGPMGFMVEDRHLTRPSSPGWRQNQGSPFSAAKAWWRKRLIRLRFR